MAVVDGTSVRPRELSGPQKAAILLVQMGRERSAKVLKSLTEVEVEDLMAEIARLHAVDPQTTGEVLEDFRSMLNARGLGTAGGLAFAKEVLETSLGSGRAKEMMDRLSSSMADAPFEFLRRTDPRLIVSFLQDEHPQTIALVLAHMHADQAAMVLSGLPESAQADVAHRVATMDRTSPDVIDRIEQILKRKLSAVLNATGFAAAGGVQPLVDILNRSDRATERLILEELEARDVDLADEVRSRMFVFEDIVTLDDRSVQLVLRDVDAKELAVALKGVRQDVREKITKNMSERAAANLVEEIDLLGPVRLKTVEEAQAAVVRIIRNLEESGQIVLSRGSDEFVV